MSKLLKQIKQRREALKLKQKDMMLRVGMSPQQYQKLEAQGNPRLETLELLAKGLKAELMLIPQEKAASVKALLDESVETIKVIQNSKDAPTIADAPWQGILDDDE